MYVREYFRKSKSERTKVFLSLLKSMSCFPIKVRLHWCQTRRQTLSDTAAVVHTTRSAFESTNDRSIQVWSVALVAPPLREQNRPYTWQHHGGEKTQQNWCQKHAEDKYSRFNCSNYPSMLTIFWCEKGRSNFIKRNSTFTRWIRQTNVVAVYTAYTIP